MLGWWYWKIPERSLVPITSRLEKECNSILCVGIVHSTITCKNAILLWDVIATCPYRSSERVYRWELQCLHSRHREQQLPWLSRWWNEVECLVEFLCEVLNGRICLQLLHIRYIHDIEHTYWTVPSQLQTAWKASPSPFNAQSKFTILYVRHHVTVYIVHCVRHHLIAASTAPQCPCHLWLSLFLWVSSCDVRCIELLYSLLGIVCVEKTKFLGISIVGQANRTGDGGIYVGSVMKG